MADYLNPFGELIGMTVVEAGNGRSKTALHVNDHLLNPHGVLHGGVVFSLADTGMGAALYSTLDDGETCATVEIKINYLRPVVSGSLTCETEVVHNGRTIAVLESRVENDGRPVAIASGTYFIARPGRTGD